MRRYLIFTVLLFPLLFSNCRKKEVTMENTHVPHGYTEDVLLQSIYFGHQSVGFDIVDGITQLVGEKRVYLMEDGMLIDKPGLYHGKNGKNKDPYSKISAFRNFIIKDDANFDIACFKFCYVDFNAATDVEDVFRAYKKMVDEVQQVHPDLDIIHFTVPLRKADEGLKLWVKDLLGRKTHIQGNIARETFNDLLRNSIDKKRLFDVAYFESLDENGNETFISYKDSKVRTLRSEYTYDGGHLSENGKSFIASKFLIFLNKL